MIIKALGEEAGLRTFREIQRVNGFSVRKGIRCSRDSWLPARFRSPSRPTATAPRR